ncbi:UDP-glucuronosyltransferase-like [Stegastes partitus]|uniref:glucuronosyltransferase n=1 Tax=Stegastes partitus TaxID=144197 RepID=A0A3B5A5D4_9TELE|nr:PREDICTED: UDP-glucuronosyltransferase-like [Stegastes partitus]
MQPELPVELKHTHARAHIKPPPDNRHHLLSQQVSLQHREEAMSSGVWFPTLGLVAWLCCLSLGSVQGGKVLVMPVDGSHWLSMKLLVKELTRRNHEVVVLVPESSLLIQGSEGYKTEIYKVPYTKAQLDENFNELRDGVFLKPPEFADVFVNVQRLVNFTSLQVTGCESLLTDEPLMSQLRAQKFDVVLTDPFLPCGSMLSHMFSIPVVYFLRGLPCELDIKANQCPSPPSYVPKFFSGFTDSMTFPQRVGNLAMTVMENYVCKMIYGHFDVLVDKYFGGGLTYKGLLSHGAIWLLRYDFILEWPRPLMPNMALIGGINCAKKAPLPADLEKFVNGSGDAGFIVFTLGSMVATMPEEKAKQFFDAFRQIPQRVVWRYTGALPKDVPDNVKVMKWLPQNDLLAHPKAKVFITHGGTHGIYEGICNAVPMLMFPLFGDQRDNVHRMVVRGVAEQLTIYDVTSEKLVTTLKKMTQDQSYKKRMVELSERHLDRPVEPLELSVFWTEFVMRHKGAAHLRVGAHDLNWFQYHSLDVICFLVLIVVTVQWLSLKCCLFCTRKCCRIGTTKRKSE